MTAAALAGGALAGGLTLLGTARGAGGDVPGPAAGVVASAATPAEPSLPTATTPAADGSTGGADPASSPASPDTDPTLTAVPATQADQPAASPPTRVAVPRLGIDMPVEPEGVNDQGQMALPHSPGVAGWYQFGSGPTDAEGATVLAAHVDSKTDGIGPFVKLGSAKVGDDVDVWTGGQRRAYRVTDVTRVAKVQLDADGLFATTGPPRLHLVTCTGAYLSGSGYDQNLVVVAEPR